MATGSIPLFTQAATIPDSSTNNIPPIMVKRKSTATAPSPHFQNPSFDASTRNDLWWAFQMPTAYLSGGVIRILWTCPATSGNVIWGARLGAVTPGDADTPYEHAMATASTVTTAVNATEAERLDTESVITLANLDSVAALDLVMINVFRDAANGSDTAASAAQILAVNFEFTT